MHIHMWRGEAVRWWYYLQSEPDSVCVSLSLRASQVHQIQQRSFDLSHRILALLWCVKMRWEGRRHQHGWRDQVVGEGGEHLYPLLGLNGKGEHCM